MRALQPKPEGYVEPARRPRGNGNGGNGGERRNGSGDRHGNGGERRGGNERRGGRDERRGGERKSFGHNNGPKERPEPANDTTEEYF